MAYKAVDLLGMRGIKSLEVCLVVCPPRPGARSWARLERDLLITFKNEFGAVPIGNTSGKNFTPDKLSKSFQYSRLVKVLKAYG